MNAEPAKPRARALKDTPPVPSPLENLGITMPANPTKSLRRDRPGSSLVPLKETQQSRTQRRTSGENAAVSAALPAIRGTRASREAVMAAARKQSSAV